MIGLSRALWALGLAGLAAGVAAVLVVATSDHTELRGALAVVGLLAGWGFIGAGLYAWQRQPDNRFGALMTATGFAWLAASLTSSNNSIAFTIGTFLGSLFFAVFAHMLLAFPGGRLNSRWERLTVGLAYFATTIGFLPALLVWDPKDFDCASCPDNALLQSDSESAAQLIVGVINALGFAVTVSALVLLWARWRRATAPQRRVLASVVFPGAAVMVFLGGTTGLQAAGGGAVAEVAYVLAVVAFAAMPFVFLGGLARARMLHSGAVRELVGQLSRSAQPGSLRDALRRALRDSSLDVLFWLPERGRFVDGEGQPAELPGQESGQAFTTVERDGQRVAALVHDPALREQEPGLLETVSAAAALALENERLDAELRARLEELRESRARIIEVGLTERRRLERNLHDGAQQRLVSLALTMRMARGKLRDDPDAADTLLGAAGEELDAALEELRELARGIHPAVLSDRGLHAALESLIARAPVPVELERSLDGRLPGAVELAAYFVVAEALTNVVKYADASHATVRAAHDNGDVTVEISDDGIGGADFSRGSGLRGLADRLSALDGRLEVVSPPGKGTTVTARIPCE